MIFDVYEMSHELFWMDFKAIVIYLNNTVERPTQYGLAIRD